jgi:hypothetical protein
MPILVTARCDLQRTPRDPSIYATTARSLRGTYGSLCATRVKGLTDLVGELSTRSDEFRVRWAAHDVRFHRTGLKHIQHPVVGALHLSYEVMQLTADPGLTLVVYSAAEGSPDDDALRLLASWAATHEPAAGIAIHNDD